MIGFDLDPQWWSLSLFFLYAEIHFRFPGIPSRYFIKQPEIIADVPHRLSPGHPFPVLVIVKDAHRFPVYLKEIKVEIIHNGERRRIFTAAVNRMIAADFWEDLFSINIPSLLRGERVKVDVCIDYRVGSRDLTLRNDNYPLTSHAPFEVSVDSQPLPKTENWYYGDIHYHSSYTSDQVEFGASLNATVTMAKSMGVDFFAVTDHAYDLDDRWDNYLVNDPELPKWRHLLKNVAELNARHPDFVIIPGEEVSAGNIKNRNVHFLILNQERFFEGSGDSAENIFRTRPQWRIPDLLRECGESTIAIAAHPETAPPLIQRLLIRRDKWRQKDYLAQGLAGLQLWNGSKRNLKSGIKVWTSLLLEGKRLTLLAGNDAHGNFNRFRQLSTPFISMKEHRGRDLLPGPHRCACRRAVQPAITERRYP